MSSDLHFIHVVDEDLCTCSAWILSTIERSIPYRQLTNVHIIHIENVHIHIDIQSIKSTHLLLVLQVQSQALEGSVP